MDPTIYLIAMLVVPVLIFLFFRINAAIVFLSLCLGSVLVQFVGPDASTILSSASARSVGQASNQYLVNLGILLLPVILTSVIMVKSVKGHAHVAYNLLPALGASALGTLLVVPLMAPGLTGTLMRLPLWTELESLQTLIISVSTLLTLLFLWMQRPKHSHDESGKH